jgi:hypothetical protein
MRLYGTVKGLWTATKTTTMKRLCLSKNGCWRVHLPAEKALLQLEKSVFNEPSVVFLNGVGFLVENNIAGVVRRVK